MGSTMENVDLNEEALATLQYYGKHIHSPVILAVMSSLLFGLLTMVSVAAVYFLFRKGIRLLSVKILLSGTLILYVSTTIYWSSIVMCAVSTSKILQHSAGELYSSSAHFTDPASKKSPGLLVQSKLLTTSLGTNIIVGDAIVWWRACVVWQSRVVYGMGFVLLMSTLAFGITSTQLSHLYSFVTPNLLFVDKYGTIAGALSFTTNILSTSLIGYKAWEHRTLLRQHLGKSGVPTQTLRVLALLVESGMIYSMLWMFALAYDLCAVTSGSLSSKSPKPFWQMMFYFVYGCLIPIIAMYPTVIIILIALNRSEIESGLVLSIHPPADIESASDSMMASTTTSSDISGPGGVLLTSPIFRGQQVPHGDSSNLSVTESSESSDSAEQKHSGTVFVESRVFHV